MQDAAFGPPDDIIGIKISLPMPCIRPGDGALPEPQYQFLGRDIAPSLRKVAFIFDFIKHNGFIINIPIQNRPAVISHRRTVLDADMSDPGLCVVIQQRAVMDGSQTSVWIAGYNNLKESVPVGRCFFLHKIVLIGQRPPDIAKGRKSCDNIAKITVIRLRGHSVKTPVSLVIRVKQNQVRFNSHLTKLLNSFLKMPEKRWIKTRKIPRCRRCAFKRIQRRFIVIIGVPFGKHAEADFVERSTCQCFQRLFLESLLLMDPGIAGGSDLEIRSPVGVSKVKCIGDTDRPMIAFRGCSGCQ